MVLSRNPFATAYHHTNQRKLLICVAFAAFAVICVIIALFVGLYHISITHVLEILWDRITSNITDSKGDNYVINFRLPRAIGALVIGATLAVSGAVMQNATNNPLAEPYTMGISSAALLGATFSIALGLSIIPGVSNEYTTIVNAFIFALIPVAIILLISQFRRLTAVGIILIGIALMYMFSSISQYIMVTSSAETLSDIYNWRVGTLGRLEDHYERLYVIMAICIPIMLIIFLCKKKLDMMYAGDRNAKTMGLDVKRFRVFTMALVSMATAAVVSFTGTIGFVGLVGPHVARAFVGSNNRFLIPCSAAFGATFLILADTVAKVSGPAGLPVGVISSAVGGPLFLYILIKYNKKVWH